MYMWSRSLPTEGARAGRRFVKCGGRRWVRCKEGVRTARVACAGNGRGICGGFFMGMCSWVVGAVQRGQAAKKTPSDVRANGVKSAVSLRSRN